MSSTNTAGMAAIICGGCQRNFAWKPELAGKRVKCKCGEKISVPAARSGSAPAQSASATRSASATNSPASKPTAKASARPAAAPVKKAPRPTPPSDDMADLDGLMALADDAERAAAAMPVETLDFVAAPVEPLPVKSSRGPAIPLGYRRGPTAVERQKAERHAAALISPMRDLYAPIGFLAAGLLLYFSSFIVRYHLPATAIVPVGFGIVILTVIKTVLLLGFAFATAGPLGVSYGTLWTGILKLAAIAVFIDGLINWVDIGVARASGGYGTGGLIGWGRIGWPLAIGLYWVMLMVFFDMDPAESRIVVACLAIFDRIVRLIVVFLLLDVILGWGGIKAPVIAAAASAGQSITNSHSRLATRVDELQESKALVEAGQYIKDGHQYALDQPVKDWYANGCKNVWFALVTTDMLNHKRSARSVIIELPTDKIKRAKCFDILKKYYTDSRLAFDPADLVDDGDAYFEFGVR